ncbi:MAG: hypothetical protein RL275_79, partial [Chloroflexota bacterium]
MDRIDNDDLLLSIVCCRLIND